MTAVDLGEITPGSTEWLALLTASKIAAVVGLSPYQSRFSVWHAMAGMTPRETQTAAMSRGHYLEPAVCAWFADQHPDVQVSPTGTWAHQDRPWQAASPDRLLYGPSLHGPRQKAPTGLLEVKTASSDDEWGPSGSDVIPAGYRAQVQWQLDTLGLEVAYVAVLTSFLEFREYVVPYDKAYAEYLRAEGLAFLNSLPGGPAEKRPDLDGSTATYETVRKLHPDIDPDLEIEVAPDLYYPWVSACANYKSAETAKRFSTSALLDAMGDARRALVNGQPVARRQPGRGGAVSLYPVTQKDVKAA